MSDISTAEFEATQRSINELQTAVWAYGLLSKAKNKNIADLSRSLRFEIRYAAELLRAGADAIYEYKTGVGDTDVDFKINQTPPWYLELVSIGESDACRTATSHSTIIPGKVDVREIHLTSTIDKDGTKQSEEGEIIKAQEKIGEKVFQNNKPVKFPWPSDAIHVIVVDVRNVFGLGGGADMNDFLEIAYGAEWADKNDLPSHCLVLNGKQNWIKGLFEKTNPQRATQYLQERIHFIHFVYERKYDPGEIQRVMSWAVNPFLFNHNKEAARLTHRSHPLAIKKA